MHPLAAAHIENSRSCSDEAQGAISSAPRLRSLADRIDRFEDNERGRVEFEDDDRFEFQ